MSDISVTAASVLEATGAKTEIGTAGAAITIGQVVYKDATASNKWKLAVNSTAAAAGASGVGIALTEAGADGQQIIVMTSGNVNPGGTVVVGEIYCVSPNAGGIAPEADVVGDDFVTFLGIGTTSSNIKLSPVVSGAQIP